MKFLLREALSQDLQLYRYQPFHNDPIPYCGTMITDTPLKLEHNHSPMMRTNDVILIEESVEHPQIQ